MDQRPPSIVLSALRGWTSLQGVVWGTVFASLVLLPVRADSPEWWSTPGLFKTGVAADDYAVINQGQLKTLAAAAVAKMNAELPDGAGLTLNALVDGWSNPTVQTDDYAVVNLGQLKALAAPFYTRLAKPYPWASAASSADDYALANIGQAKALFSFSITVFDGVLAHSSWQTLQAILDESFTDYLTADEYASLQSLLTILNATDFRAALQGALNQADPPAAAQTIDDVLPVLDSEGAAKIAQTPVLSSTPLAAGDDGLWIERFGKWMFCGYAQWDYPDNSILSASYTQWYFDAPYEYSPWTGEGIEFGPDEWRGDVRDEFESAFPGTAHSYYLPIIVLGDPTMPPWGGASTYSTRGWINDRPDVDEYSNPLLFSSRWEDRSFARLEFNGPKIGTDDNPQTFSGSRTYLAVLRDYSEIGPPEVLGAGTITFILNKDGTQSILKEDGSLAPGILTTDEHTWLEMRIPVPSGSLAELDDEGELNWALDLTPVEVEILRPGVATDSEWSDPKSKWAGDKKPDWFVPYQPNGQDNHDLKLRIKLGGTQITNDLKTKIDYELAAYTANERDTATWKKFTVKATDRISPDGTQIWVTLPKAEWVSVIPATSSHNPTKRAATFDFATTGNFSDSDAFESFYNNPLFSGTKLSWGVHARFYDVDSIGNWQASDKTTQAGTIKPWATASTKATLCSGGLDYLEFRLAGATSGSRAVVEDQVDWLYYSGHGHSGTGKLDVFNGTVGASDVRWSSGLEVAILAGCSILDINNLNGNTLEPGADSPGKAWAKVGPEYLLGYNFTAPSDTQGLDLPGPNQYLTAGDIITQWAVNQNSADDYVVAWRIANDIKSGHNACAIKSGNTYFYFKRTTVLGVPSYNWTQVNEADW